MARRRRRGKRFVRSFVNGVMQLFLNVRISFDVGGVAVRRENSRGEKLVPERFDESTLEEWMIVAVRFFVALVGAGRVFIFKNESPGVPGQGAQTKKLLGNWGFFRATGFLPRQYRVTHGRAEKGKRCAQHRIHFHADDKLEVGVSIRPPTTFAWFGSSADDPRFFPVIAAQVRQGQRVVPVADWRDFVRAVLAECPGWQRVVPTRPAAVQAQMRRDYKCLFGVELPEAVS